MLLFLFPAQFIRKSIENRHAFVAVIQQPLYALQIVMRVIILHGIHLARAVRRNVLAYRFAVQAVQPRNSFQIFVHRRASSMFPRIVPSLENIEASRLHKQLVAQLLRYENPAFLAGFLLCDGRSIAPQ